MKWKDLIEIVGNEPVFSSSLLMAGKQSRANIQLQLTRWGKAGKIIQLRRGLYVLSNPYRKVQPHPFLLANSIKKASYISLQSALSFYGMIPENVPAVTGVTTSRPEIVNTAEGTFIFKHIKKSLFKGYCRTEVSDRQSIFIATPEKSLLDLIYLTPGGHTLEYLRELRLQNFERLDLNVLEQLVQEKPNYLLRKSVVREYLQARVLQALQDHGVFMNWAFLGGTALRFLYNIPRYSEDLDFSLIEPDKDCGFVEVLRRIKFLFESENYGISIKISPTKTVMSAFLKFPGLLNELGISPHRDETLSIKFEIDTNPPKGAEMSTTIVRHFVTVNINHYDKASLLAGKLHAVLARQYTKGRDLYDLVWYLSDRTWPSPNYRLLNAALMQTGWKGDQVDKNNLKDILAGRMRELQWEKVKDDLLPFLERPQDIEMVSCENCLKLISEKQF